MEESGKTVSDKHGVKTCLYSNQCYDAPSGKFGKIFVGILYVELDRVRARKWNVERVVVFQSVILQRTQGVNNSAKNSSEHCLNSIALIVGCLKTCERHV